MKKDLPNKERKISISDAKSDDGLEKEIQKQIDQNREINKALEKLLKSVTEDQSIKKENI